jgi:hypothetical protein
MKLISCRAGFIAPASFGPHMMQSPPADPVPGYPRDLAGWMLIPGYHTTPGGAESSFHDIEQRLPGVPMFGYLWPGGDLALDFPLSVIRSREAGWRLADVMSGQPDGLLIDGQTHSLGAGVLLRALCTGAFNMGHAILSGAAVNANSLQPGGEFAAAADHCQSLTVAYSANDPVLGRAYPLSAFHEALGLHGPVDASHLPANVRLWDCSRIVHEHGGYRYAPEYFAAWLSIKAGWAKSGLTVL